MSIVEPSSVDCVIYHADCTDGLGQRMLRGNALETGPNITHVSME